MCLAATKCPTTTLHPQSPQPPLHRHLRSQQARQPLPHAPAAGAAGGTTEHAGMLSSPLQPLVKVRAPCLGPTAKSLYTAPRRLAQHRAVCSLNSTSPSLRDGSSSSDLADVSMLCWLKPQLRVKCSPPQNRSTPNHLRLRTPEPTATLHSDTQQPPKPSEAESTTAPPP